MKNIKDYPGYYITEAGVVFSDKYGKLLEKKPKNNKGYFEVDLYNNGKRKAFKVHRLVAEAFIPNPLNLPQVNHINEVKNDNRVENLEWCSAQQNCEFTNAKVHRIKKLSTGDVFEVHNLNKWCRDNGLHPQSLHSTKRGERKPKDYILK